MLFILFVFASADAFSRFGCDFDDKNFALNSTDDKFSEARSANVVFDTKKDFRDFYDKVDKIRSEEVGNMVFNNLDPFITMFRAYLDSRKHAVNKILSVSDFYKSYRPTYPPSGDDGTPALMRVYEKIVNLNHEVVDSFVLGSSEFNVDQSVYKKRIHKHVKGDFPPNDFKHDRLIGLIRISVAGELGFIIIDMNEPKGQTPIVMYRQGHELNRDRVQKTPSHRTYSNYRAVFAYNNEYINIKTYTHYYEETNSEFRDSLIREDLLYTSRSLCSFLQSSVKRSLFNPERYINKYSSDGVYEAYVRHNVLRDSDVYYTITPPTQNISSYGHAIAFRKDDGFAIKTCVKFFNPQYEETLRSYIEDVEKRIKFEKNKLRAKIIYILIILQNTLAENALFVDEVDKIYQQLKKPSKLSFFDKFKYTSTHCF